MDLNLALYQCRTNHKRNRSNQQSNLVFLETFASILFCPGSSRNAANENRSRKARRLEWKFKDRFERIVY